MRKNIVLVCLTALAVAGVVPAFGAVKQLITGKQIKNHSIAGVDIKNRTIALKNLKLSTIKSLRGAGQVGTPATPGAQGENGTAGANGTNGTNGAAGADGSQAFSTAKWGVIGRNSKGSPVADLRAGPLAHSSSTDLTASTPPPAGVGSLGIAVGGVPPSGTTTDAEKLNYGNEFDFAGLALSGITHLSYGLFTDEDPGSAASHSAPAIAMEVYRQGTSGYSSFTYLPDASSGAGAPPRTTGAWQTYDTIAAGSKWYSSQGSICAPANPCTWDELKAAFPNAKVAFSLGFSKGRDNSFHGAVDALRVNDTIYDFEPGGVFPTAAP